MYQISVYSQASKFVLDHNLSWGDKIISYPKRCKVSEVKFANPNIFIDKKPRPGYQSYIFKDKSRVNIEITGKFLGIVGAYNIKKVKTEDEYASLMAETKQYDEKYAKKREDRQI